MPMRLRRGCEKRWIGLWPGARCQDLGRDEFGIADGYLGVLWGADLSDVSTQTLSSRIEQNAVLPDPGMG